MAAASEYLANFLRSTAVLEECEPDQARQLLSNECGEFSHTLIIPDAAFRCHYCGAEERTGGSFRCVICDGQVLSVLQQHLVSILRPGMNSPRVDFSLIFACALRSAKMRRLVRNRVRAPTTNDTALTTAEVSAWSVYAAARLAVPPTGGPDVIAARTPTEKTAALLWSSSILCSTFYEVVGCGEREQAPMVPREPAGGAVVDLFAAAEYASDGDDLDGDATSTAESMVDLVAASGSPDGSTAAVKGPAAQMTDDVERLSLARSTDAEEAADAEEDTDPEASIDDAESTDPKASTDDKESTVGKGATDAKKSTDA